MDPAPRPPLRLAGAGLTLAADAYGPDDGPPVVLFHGGGQTRHSWGGTARLLGDKGWRATTVDLRGHGDSDWAGTDGRRCRLHARRVRRRRARRRRPYRPPPPVLIGASLGGLSSLVAIGEADRAGPAVAAGLVLVDVAPRLEAEGHRAHRASFMLGNLDGFADLEEVADAVAAYNPHRPRPTDLSGLRKNVRLRDDGRWYWHWDPVVPHLPGSPSTRPAAIRNENRLEDAARAADGADAAGAGPAERRAVRGGRPADAAELMPHARYVDVGGAGHMVAGDRNDAFNDAVIEFLREELPA